MIPNRKAFLDMIAAAEGTRGIGDDGYNVIVGSTRTRPVLFSSYVDHPRVYVKAYNSTAAGRYQLLARYYDHYKKLLKLPDFSPASQDAIALQQIREFRALPLIDAGQIDAAIRKVSKLWASFPGAGYGQHEQRMETLLAAYSRSGGMFA